MRILVFFDLPTETSSDRREYRRFRKMLIREGFIMMQESVYTKLLLNSTAQKSLVEKIKKQKPERGLIQYLTITERQFASMEFITGERKDDVLDSDERTVFL